MPKKYPGYRHIVTYSDIYLKVPTYKTVRYNWKAKLEHDDMGLAAAQPTQQEDFDADEPSDINDERRLDPISVETFIRYRQARAKHETVKQAEMKALHSQESGSGSFNEEEDDYDFCEESAVVPVPVPQKSVSASKSSKHQQPPPNGRIMFAKMMLTRPPSRTPTLSRTTSIPTTIDVQPKTQKVVNNNDEAPAPPSLGRSVSAPGVSTSATSSLSYRPSPPRRARNELPFGVHEVALVPSRCLSTTVVNKDTQSALEVAWRLSTDGGLYLRVLGVIGVDGDMACKFEKHFRTVIMKELSHRRSNFGAEVSLPELTSLIMSNLPKLELLLVETLPLASDGGRYSQGHCHTSWNNCLQSSLSLIARYQLDVLTPFDQWSENDELDKAVASSSSSYQNNGNSLVKSGLGKYKLTKAQSVFGSQECVVCGDVWSSPQLGSDGQGSGGAAMSACGHWCCVEVSDQFFLIGALLLACI
jgi:hypothetical protein